MTVCEDQRAEELRRRYLSHQVQTASPTQRLLMLQAQVLRDLHAASEAFDDRTIEPVHRSLVHAQEIVLVLRDSLNGSDWKGALPLQSVYTFIHQRLVMCNLTKDSALLADCIKLIEQIYQANLKALATLTGAPQAAEGTTDRVGAGSGRAHVA